MGSNRTPRSGPVQPFEGYPAFGAFHDVIPNEQLYGFLYDFRRIADLILKRSVIGEPIYPITTEDFEQAEGSFFGDANEEIAEHPVLQGFDLRNYGKIFDIDRLGVSVVEMNKSARAARQVRAVWEKHDFGAVEQEARNEVDRRTGYKSVSLRFSGVMGVGRRLPGLDRADVRQKLALVPKGPNNHDAIDMIETEGQIITGAINRRLKQFMGKWDTVPHLTFAYFNQRAKPEAVEAIEESADMYSRNNPCGARLGELVFRHMSSRTEKPRR